MTTATATHERTGLPGPVPDGARLAGTTVGALGTAEQFALWAFRRRLADGAPGSDRLVAGFRLALGLSLLEPGLAAFELAFATARTSAGRDLHLAPLRCACLTRDEVALLSLLASAQAGEGHGPIGYGYGSATALAGRDASASVSSAACGLALILARADLRLPRRPASVAAGRLN